MKIFQLRMLILSSLFVFYDVFAAEEDLRERVNVMFGQLPRTMPGSESDTIEQIKLGEQLCFETALSGNHTQSRNSCHNILDGGAGVDHLKTSLGALGQEGLRNAPTT